MINNLNSCTTLQSIPVGLFNYNSNVTSFTNCFSNCTSLNRIPVNLFGGYDLMEDRREKLEKIMNRINDKSGSISVLC